jgi:hypothetical protein
MQLENNGRRYGELILITTFAMFAIGCSESDSQHVISNKPASVSKPIKSIPPTAFEISLAQSSLPNYVVVSGLSEAEVWGRWSDADRVIFQFGSSLPKKFALAISARAFGPNAGLPIPVKVGSETQEIKLLSDVTKTVRLVFSSPSDNNKIELVVPEPTVPKNGDKRALGIAFFSVKIAPLP